MVQAKAKRSNNTGMVIRLGEYKDEDGLVDGFDGFKVHIKKKLPKVKYVFSDFSLKLFIGGKS